MSLLINNSFQTQLRPELRYYQSSPSLFSCMVWLSFFWWWREKRKSINFVVVVISPSQPAHNNQTFLFFHNNNAPQVQRHADWPVCPFDRSFVCHSFIHSLFSTQNIWCVCGSLLDCTIQIAGCQRLARGSNTPQSTFFHVFAHHTTPVFFLCSSCKLDISRFVQFELESIGSIR